MSPFRQILAKFSCIALRQKNLRVAAAGNHRPVELRIQGTEFIKREFGKLRRHLDIDVAGLADGDEVRLVVHLRQRQAVHLRCGDDVLDRLQLRHVIAGLGWHQGRQAIEIGRQAGSLVLRNRALHRAFTPVVGGQRQLPVAEHAVQLLQIGQCRIGRGQHVTPLVLEHVLLELEVKAGRRNELPHASRLGT